jgi:hypothetical protein
MKAPSAWRRAVFQSSTAAGFRAKKRLHERSRRGTIIHVLFFDIVNSLLLAAGAESSPCSLPTVR